MPDNTQHKQTNKEYLVCDQRALVLCVVLSVVFKRSVSLEYAVAQDMSDLRQVTVFKKKREHSNGANK
jgi:hypothetical protein